MRGESFFDRVRERADGGAWSHLSDADLAEFLDLPVAVVDALRGGCALDQVHVEAALPADVAERWEAWQAFAARLYSRPFTRGDAFLSPRQIFEAGVTRYRGEKRERFDVVLLDARHRVQQWVNVSVGSLTSSIVHPREVFAPAVRASAGAMVFVHNHPSGEPSPSEDDIAVTRRLERAAEVLGIRVLDHVIIGDGCYSSFKEMGLI